MYFGTDFDRFYVHLFRGENVGFLGVVLGIKVNMIPWVLLLHSVIKVYYLKQLHKTFETTLRCIRDVNREF